jgi:hypothetical protein
VNGHSANGESEAFRISFPPELYKWAADIARTADESLAQFVLRAVEREVDRRILRGGPEFVASLEKLGLNGHAPETTRPKTRRRRTSPA